MSERVILFDGVCNLCDGFIRFVFKNDPSGRFRFAPLQSAVGQELLARHGLIVLAGDPDSVVLIDDGHAWTRSSAALRILGGLRGPWPAFTVFLAVPIPLRDGVYRLIARNRYRLFGKKDACSLPPAGLRERFLTQE
jgi:predicted DCC family thiol-disulfide oxidoreductase YuxK